MKPKNNIPHTLSNKTHLPPAVRLKVLEGPHKGVSYKLVSAKITIGRSSENDIILSQDKKCSRRQALVMMAPNGHYSIKDLSQRASLKVNSIIKMQSDLADGDIIEFGKTVMQFENPLAQHPLAQNPLVQNPGPLPATAGALALAPTSAQADPAALNLVSKPSNQEVAPLGLVQDNVHASAQQTHFAFPKAKAQKKINTKFKIVLAVLGLGVLWLLMQDSDKNDKKQKDSLKTMLEREEDVKTLQELKQKEQDKRSINNLPSYQNAQSEYIKGIRDYRKGFYSRAIESFRVCRTIFPKHKLCSSYMEKAKVKNQQLIQAWMVAGKNYRQKRRFVSCMSSFKNVMVTVQNLSGETYENDMVYKEAEENYDICKIQHEDRY